MPSGKTHDAITVLLAPPVFAITYAATENTSLSAALTAAFLFGGLMFGPDLDTVSVQYSRWWFFRALWYPYRAFFKHRSRWSHGLVFGTLFRVVYLMGALTVAAFLAVLASSIIFGNDARNLVDLAAAWKGFGSLARLYLGERIILAVFLGMWIGAASHTFTDMAGSYVKTGRVTEFL